MTSTLCQARRPRLPLAAGRERHGHRSGVVGDAQRGWWMNGGGGCDVYWLLTWVGNSNHPCQNVKTNRIQWFGTKDGETFLFFFNEQFDGPSKTSFSVGRSNTSGILSKTLPKQRLEEDIISNKQMVVTLW